MRLPNKGKQCLISMLYIEPLMNAEILCNFTPQFPCASKPPPLYIILDRLWNIEHRNAGH